MCDSNTQAILESIVRTKVASLRNNGRTGEMFTAFDISRTAQQAHGVKERHVYMKNDIHRLFNDGYMQTPDGTPYVRTTIQLPGVPVDPWLYYPQGDDPTEYVSQHTGVAPQSVTPALPALPAQPALSQFDAIKNQPDVDDGKKRSDRRGRIWVPVKHVSGLGLKPGDVAYVVKSNPGLQIKANLGPSDVEAVVYKVDPSGNIAISKGCLVEAGLVGDVFDVDGNATEITVK